VKVADVKINQVPDEEAARKRSNIKIQITDKEKNTVITYIEHPLYRRFDVYEESGKIESKLVSLPEADMTIRVPYYVPYSKIELTETIDGKQGQSVVLKNEK